jgi:hypothetical protein
MRGEALEKPFERPLVLGAVSFQLREADMAVDAGQIQCEQDRVWDEEYQADEHQLL